MSKPLAEDQRALLQQARVAKLIGAWANATRRLTPEEIAEVEAVHPGLINTQPPGEGPAAASPFSSFTLTGDTPLPAKLRGYYKRPYREYAAVYGYDPASGERTIKRFVSLGRAAVPHDLPPLDDPGAMPAWWRRHHGTREVPAGIRHAAAATTTPAATVISPAPATREPALTARAEAHPLSAGGDICRSRGLVGDNPSNGSQRARDFPAQVENIRRVTDDHAAQLDSAKAEPEPPGLIDPVERAEWARSKAERVEAAQRNYKTSFEMQRKAENDLVEWEKAHGELAPRPAVASEVTRIVSSIHSAVKRLTRTVRPRLAGKSDAEQDAIWEDETRKCFRILASTKFHDAAILTN